MDLPKRKRQRKSNFDYSTPGYYFVTICIHQKKHLLSRISTDIAKSQCRNELSPYGKIALDELNELPVRYPNIRIDKAVIMPNHIHAIVVINENPPAITLSEIICAYKSLTVKRCHEYGLTEKLFQSSFHDHIIRSQTDYEKIWLYIHSNPQNWQKDCFY